MLSLSSSSSCSCSSIFISHSLDFSTLISKFCALKKDYQTKFAKQHLKVLECSELYYPGLRSDRPLESTSKRWVQSNKRAQHYSPLPISSPPSPPAQPRQKHKSNKKNLSRGEWTLKLPNNHLQSPWQTVGQYTELICCLSLSPVFCYWDAWLPDLIAYISTDASMPAGCVLRCRSDSAGLFIILTLHKHNVAFNWQSNGLWVCSTHRAAPVGGGEVWMWMWVFVDVAKAI